MLPLIPLVLWPTLAGSFAGLVWYHSLDQSNKDKYNERFARLGITFARNRQWVPNDMTDEEILAWLGKDGDQERDEIKMACERVSLRMFLKEPRELDEGEARRLIDFVQAEAASGKSPAQIS